jgi:hypothetical protein
MVEELWKFRTRRTGLSACNWTGLGLARRAAELLSAGTSAMTILVYRD